MAGDGMRPRTDGDGRDEGRPRGTSSWDAGDVVRLAALVVSGLACLLGLGALAAALLA